jgi:FMN phosphatase YigB (HAD superfamily)
MGDAIHDSIVREFDWIRNFDVLVWSYQLHIAKPDAAIYLHTLEKLGAKPEQTIFIDDKRVNIEAAQALGIKGFEFITAEQLRADLIAAGFDAALPLP